MMEEIKINKKEGKTHLLLLSQINFETIILETATRINMGNSKA